jgi:glucose/mannose-6-phosphate isomerase
MIIMDSNILDDLNKIQQIDKSNMLDTLADFPNQIKEAVEIASSVNIETFFKIDNVIITGMGASGISGDIIASLFRDKIDVPIYINKEYDLPKWARKDTLTLFYSYSGNTEETISAFKIASQKKCRAICVSSGGKLKELAEKRNISFISIPSGYQPRAAIAYSLFTLLVLMKRIGLIKYDIDSEIDETKDILKDLIRNNNKSIPTENNLSKQIAERIKGTIPQIYGWGIYSSIATRWRQQFNENSKIISRDDTVPESTHNDIVGWSSNQDISKKFSCIIFRDKNFETLQMSTKLNFLTKLFENTSANIIEVNTIGKKRLAKILYLLCLGDFVSCYLAILRETDPTPIDIINDLKLRIKNL